MGSRCEVDNGPGVDLGMTRASGASQGVVEKRNGKNMEHGNYVVNIV